MKEFNKQGIIFLGDTHGNFDVVKKICQQVENFAIIHVGDVGLGFNSFKTENEILTKKLQPCCSLNNNDLFFLRGNHDSKKRFGQFRSNDLQHIIFPDDYESVKINDKIFLFVGGATSIDRNGRAPEISYWEDESVVFQRDKCTKCDVLVTHTSPSWCFPQAFNEMVYGWAREDAYLLEDLNEERAIMDEICKLCNPELHVYGHFHSSWSEKINNCTHRLLSINEAWEFRA